MQPSTAKKKQRSIRRTGVTLARPRSSRVETVGQSTPRGSEFKGRIKNKKSRLSEELRRFLCLGMGGFTVTRAFIEDTKFKLREPCQVLLREIMTQAAFPLRYIPLNRKVIGSTLRAAHHHNHPLTFRSQCCRRSSPTCNFRAFAHFVSLTAFMMADAVVGMSPRQD